MDGDGHGDGDGELGVFEGGDEGDHSLGEVVDGQHEGGDQPGAQQAVVAEGLGLMPHALLGAHLLDVVHFVRVFGLRYEEVDDEDEEDAAEEGQRGERAAHLGAVEGGEGADGVGQEFDKGDVNHHPSRETEGERKEGGVGAAGEERDGAADAGGESGEQGEQKGRCDGRHRRMGVY